MLCEIVRCGRCGFPQWKHVVGVPDKLLHCRATFVQKVFYFGVKLVERLDWSVLQGLVR